MGLIRQQFSPTANEVKISTFTEKSSFYEANYNIMVMAPSHSTEGHKIICKTKK